jgi:hypothetical protein
MFALSALWMVLSTSPASAGPSGSTRDVRGQVVDLDVPGTVLAFWRLDCLTCGSELRDLAAQGARVVAVNLDGAQAQSHLLPWMRRRGLAVPVVADPNGELWARFAPHAGGEAGARAGAGLAVHHLDEQTAAPKSPARLATRASVGGDLATQRRWLAP